MNQESYWLEIERRHSAKLAILIVITLLWFILAMFEFIDGFLYKPLSLFCLISGVSMWIVINRKAGEARKKE
jgi:hypothetical protein